jgi:DNA invertase Pin-like site-specific DNA recombinase
MKKYIAYYRVSTKEQGESGLGLDAQVQSCRDYILGSGGELIGEFQDIESGTSDSRRGIQDAITRCKETGSTLVVKEISRISRGGFKIMVLLEEAGIEFIESTAPYDPMMVKGIKFVMAKDEREKISERTTRALGEIKRKISSGGEHISKAGNVVYSLGTPGNLTDESRQRSAEVRRERSFFDSDNRKAGALILALKEAGKSFYYIKNVLNDSGFKTSRGNSFSEVQTKRLYLRYAS